MFLCCTANLVTTKVMPQETSKIDSNIDLNLKNILNIYFVFWVTHKKGQHVLKIIGGLNGCLCIVSYRQRISYIILCKDSQDAMKVYNDNPERFEANGNA